MNDKLTKPTSAHDLSDQKPSPLIDIKLNSIYSIPETAVMVANSTSPNLSNGIVEGHPEVVLDDVFGRAMLFHDSNDSISIPNIAPLADPTGVLKPFSLEIWVNPDVSLANTWAPALSVGEASGPFWALIVGSFWSGFVWSDKQGQSLQSLELDQPIMPGQWSNLTITYDQANLSLYVNGKIGKSATLQKGLPWNDHSQLLLGSDSVLGNSMGIFNAIPFKQMEENISGLRGVLFSPNSERMIIFRNKLAPQVRDVRNGSEPWEITDTESREEPFPTGTVTFHPGGNFLVAGVSGGVKIWSVITKRVSQIIQTDQDDGFTPPYFDTAKFSPDGQLIIAHSTWAWSILDVKSGKVIRTLDAEEEEVADVAFSSDGNFALIALENGLIKVLHVRTGAIWRLVGKIDPNRIGSASFSPDGRLVASSDHNQIQRVWNLEKIRDTKVEGTQEYKTSNAINEPNAIIEMMVAVAPMVEISADGKVVAFSPDNTLVLLGRNVLDLLSNTISSLDIRTVVSAEFSLTDKLLLTATNDSVQIWEVPGFKKRELFSGFKNIQKVQFSPDGRRIAIQEYDKVTVLLTPNRFSGRMAHLKLSLGAPPAAAEVRQQVERAILKAATGTNFPLEFSLENDQKQAVIYLGNVPKSVHFLVKNTGRRTIYFDHGGRAASHFELRFRPGALASPEGIGVEADAKYPGWSLQYHREPDGTDVLGFSHTPGANTADSALMPGEALPLTLTNVQADERGGSRSTRIQLRYSLQYDNFNPVEGSRLHYLAILQMPESEIQNNLNALLNEKIPDLKDANNAAAADIKRIWTQIDAIKRIEALSLQLAVLPLAAWIEGSPFVINNGQTINELYLQIGNIGEQGANLKLHNTPQFQTTFWVDVGPNQDRGLLTLSNTNEQTVFRALAPEFVPAQENWDIKADTDGFKLVYTGPADGQSLNEGEVLSIRLRFLCSTRPGHAHLVVRYGNIGQAAVIDGRESYPHGHLSLNLIRSPFAPERSKDGTTKTVVSGKLDLVQTAESLPTIELYRGGWQVSKENAPDATLGLTDDSKPEISAPDATLGLTDDGKLEISSQHGISLKGGVVAENLTINGEFHADGHTISAKEVNAVGVTADAYKLTGYEPHLHDYGYIVPKGGIIMWSGRPEDIPQGWVLCDGRQVTAQGKFVTTPDLTDKFIRGAGRTYNPGTFGGQALVTLTEREMPQHAHSITDPKHKHTLPNTQIGTRVEFAGWNGHNEVYFQVPMDMNKEVDAQGTGISINPSGDGQPFPIIPPFYALCFIMKL